MTATSVYSVRDVIARIDYLYDYACTRCSPLALGGKSGQRINVRFTVWAPRHEKKKKTNRFHWANSRSHYYHLYHITGHSKPFRRLCLGGF